MPDFTYKGKIYYNPVQLVMEQIGGTWKAPILWRLKNNVMRYGELRKDIPHISDKMLTTQLRELEEDGYISRKVYAVVPPKTEYALTKQGVEILKLITVIRKYGLKMIEKQGISPERLIARPGLQGGMSNTVKIRPAAEGEMAPDTSVPFLKKTSY